MNSFIKVISYSSSSRFFAIRSPPVAAAISARASEAKELPNTGTEQSSASLALALLAAATGGLLFAKKREEEE